MLNMCATVRVCVCVCVCVCSVFICIYIFYNTIIIIIQRFSCVHMASVPQDFTSVFSFFDLFYFLIV